MQLAVAGEERNVVEEDTATLAMRHGGRGRRRRRGTNGLERLRRSLKDGQLDHRPRAATMTAGGRHGGNARCRRRRSRVADVDGGEDNKSSDAAARRGDTGATQVEAAAGGPLAMRLRRGGRLSTPRQPVDVDHERQHYGPRRRHSGSPKLDGDAKMIHPKSSQPYARSGDQAEVSAEQDDEDVAAVTEAETALSWTTRSRRCRRAAVGDANPISDREKKKRYSSR